MRRVGNFGQSHQIISDPTPRAVAVVKVSQTLAIRSALFPTITFRNRASSVVITQEVVNPLDLVVMEVTRLARGHFFRGATLAPTQQPFLRRTRHALVVLAHPQSPASLGQSALVLPEFVIVKDAKDHFPGLAIHLVVVGINLHVPVDPEPQKRQRRVVFGPADEVTPSGRELQRHVVRVRLVGLRRGRESHVLECPCIYNTIN